MSSTPHPLQHRNVSLTLFQPDIPQNAGNLFRTAACFGVPVHLVEPCGFVLSDSKMRRAGMDYLTHVNLTRHQSWQSYLTDRPRGRLVLLTTKGADSLERFSFENGDNIILGRESAGVPDDVHDASDARVSLTMAPGLRSMNVAVCGGIVLFEALRQLKALPV